LNATQSYARLSLLSNKKSNMKYQLFFFFLLLSVVSVKAEGIEFFHGTWEEALEAAKTQDKVIFVDAYTTWCGPCKRMSKTVFTKEDVGEFYNRNFINMKIDMEKPEGRAFQQKYPVAAFPTLYYIDGDGKTVYNTKGARSAEQFLELGRTVLGKTDKSEEFAEKYEAGDRGPELVLNYVKALNKAGKPSLKIANDYLHEQENMTSEFNLQFIYEAVVEADSRIFNLLIENRTAIERLTSKEAVDQKIHEACNATAKKALEFKFEALHEEAKAKMEANCPEHAQVFIYDADLNYYRTMKDAKNYVKTCNSYVKKVVKNNAKELHTLAKDLKISFAEDNKAMKLAEKLSEKAAKNGGLYEYYYTYAEILMLNGKSSDALKAANKSMALADGKANIQRAIQGLIDKINKA
jgi:thioredoxin-related protein